MNWEKSRVGHGSAECHADIRRYWFEAVICTCKQNKCWTKIRSFHTPPNDIAHNKAETWQKLVPIVCITSRAYHLFAYFFSVSCQSIYAVGYFCRARYCCCRLSDFLISSSVFFRSSVCHPTYERTNTIYHRILSTDLELNAVHFRASLHWQVTSWNKVPCCPHARLTNSCCFEFHEIWCKHPWTKTHTQCQRDFNYNQQQPHLLGVLSCFLGETLTQKKKWIVNATSLKCEEPENIGINWNKIQIESSSCQAIINGV